LQHLNFLRENKNSFSAPSEHFFSVAEGRYFTGEMVGRHLSYSLIKECRGEWLAKTSIKVLDPFGGDGRLICWLIEEAAKQKCLPQLLEVEIWDISDVFFQLAKTSISSVARDAGLKVRIKTKKVDSFTHAKSQKNKFDAVITNPPWELLKPDRRELEVLRPSVRPKYLQAMKEYDSWLNISFPLSAPKRKFAGWGTNLSRVGLELAIELSKADGQIGIVLPASFLADHQSDELRRHVVDRHSLRSIGYFPAEVKQYGAADIPSITLIARKDAASVDAVSIEQFGGMNEQGASQRFSMHLSSVKNLDYVIPISVGPTTIKLLERLAKRLPTWGDMERHRSAPLWAGREIDETLASKHLVAIAPEMAGYPFIKGRMIDRFSLTEKPSFSLPDSREVFRLPKSVGFRRIVWRDISRPNQTRRTIATLAEKGHIAGNSLGVAYFEDGNEDDLLCLLGIFNSLVFEIQLRAHLATGHISLSAVRKVHTPTREFLSQHAWLAKLVRSAIRVADFHAFEVDAYVAKFIYKLSEIEYQGIIKEFSKLDAEHQHGYIESFRKLSSISTAKN